GSVRLERSPFTSRSKPTLSFGAECVVLLRMRDDDYRLPTRGPGWLGVIVTSVLSSCVVLIAFLWALQHGVIMVPALREKGGSSAAAAATPTAGHVAVPPLVGLSTATAVELLNARGLRLVVRQKRAHSAALDTVIAQDPLADSRLPRDSAVVVVLSSGPAPSGAVPNLAGKPLADALKELEAAGFKPEDVGPDAGPRVVTGSEPAAGKALERGASVKLLLAPAGLEMPKLTGISLTKAKAAIAELGLKLGKVRSRYDDDIAAYLILTQTPAAGEIVQKGATVELVYSEE
ncbi:MAG TPA: PASTA domain-containing protein, partial [Polyangiales bacterium]